MDDAITWWWSHLKPEGSRLVMGMGALAVASFVNFRTGTQLKKALEDLSLDGGRNVQAVLCRSFLLFSVGAVSGCVRTAFFDSSTERLRASLAYEVLEAKLLEEPSEEQGEQTAAAVKPEQIDAEQAKKVAGVGSAAALDVDIGLCADALPKLQNLVRYTFSVVGGTAVMLRSSLKLTAVVWPLLVTGAVHGGRAAVKSAGKSAVRIANAREEAWGFAEERLQHADVVRWFGRAYDEAAAFRIKCLECISAASKAARTRGISHMVLDLAGKSVILGVATFGGMLVQRGELTAGGLTAFFFHSSLTALGLVGLTGLAPELASAHAAAKRLLPTVAKARVLRATHIAALPAGAGEAQPAAASIQLKGVSFAYPGRDAVLNGVDLEVKAGETCALVGPSGCGKTTVARLLLGDYRARPGGSISIDGRHCDEMPKEELRRLVTIVPQQPALLGPSIKEAITFGAVAGATSPLTSKEIEAVAGQACAHGFVSARPGGYESEIGRGGSLLSAGQRQRLAVARALIRKTPVVILDEPTSALDAACAASLSQTLVAKQEGRPTMIVITHSLSLIRACDVVAVLSEDGKIVQKGPYSTLIADTKGYLAGIVRDGVLQDTPSVES